LRTGTVRNAGKEQSVTQAGARAAIMRNPERAFPGQLANCAGFSAER